MTIRPVPYPRSKLPAGRRPVLVVPGEVVDVPEQGIEVPRPRPERAGEPAAASLRVAILSLREVRPIADFGGLVEAEDVLVDALAAGLYRVVVTSYRYSRPPLSSPALRRALNSSRVAHPYRIEHHQQHGHPADVLLVLARDLRDASVLVGVPGWHQLGQQVMVHLASVAERDLRRYPELVGQLRRRVDALFVGSEMPPLGHLRSPRLRTVEVVPPLLDVLAFPGRSGAVDRTIDVFSPGPEPPGQHRLLRAWADRYQGSYQQDIGQLGAVTSLAQHRKIFTAMATRSRVFLTNYHRLGRRRQAGEHREVGTRFYEAMAAGCALAGDLPMGSRQFGEYVAEAGPLQFPLDAERLPAEVADALTDPVRSQRLGAVARTVALRGNDVAHRWVRMATMAGVPVSPGIEARISQLAGLAVQVEDELAEARPDGSGRPDEPGGSGAGGHRDPALDRT